MTDSTSQDKPTFYVINPTYGFHQVLRERGYKAWTTETLGNHDPDIVCWMGGTDINPAIYGEKPGSFTQSPDHSRDKFETMLWEKYRDKRKVGICRGAQLLGALNGAKLEQHIEGHGYGKHPVVDKEGRTFVVCSVHHQAVIPPSDFTVISWHPKDYTAEALFVPKDNALLFQAHPEFGPQSCTDYFFQLLEEYLL